MLPFPPAQLAAQTGDTIRSPGDHFVNRKAAS
jgi:hypothetical protein